MPITTCVPNQAKADFVAGVHLSTDTYKMALFTNAATLGATNATYSATNEVVGTGYTAGGATMIGFSASLSSTTGVLDFTTDPTWANSTITARGCMIYNASKSNKVIYIGDFGADISSTADTFTATLPVADAATGLLRIA